MNVATSRAESAGILNSGKVLNILLGTLFLVISAKTKIILPLITPVPFTMQTLAAMAIGLFLGKRDGFLCCLIYLIQIGVGLPFSANFSFNPLVLIGPTGGYLLALPLQSYLTGAFAERYGRCNFFCLSLLITGASLIQLLIGATWLRFFIGANNLWQAGFLPFLPGDVLKSIVVATLIKRMR